MSRSAITTFFVSGILMLALQGGARAQFKVQSLSLEPGWNPVHLEVDPADPSSAGFIESSGGRIESIWTYDNQFGGERAFEPAEFDESIETPPVRLTNRWHLYHPAHPQASDLYQLSGSRAYLIKVRADSERFTVEVIGRPTPSDPFWVPDDFSLKGFLVVPGESPTFASYFSGSPVHLAAGSRIFSLNADGRFTGPLDKNTARIDPGRAYWIYTAGTSQYTGPVEVTGAGRDGLDFGISTVEATLELRNTTSEAQEVILRLRGTLGETPPGNPASAGDISMLYLKVEGEASAWVDLGEEGVAVVLQPASAQTARIKVRRQGLPVAVVKSPSTDAGTGEQGNPGPDVFGSSYQGELELTTAGGTRQVLAATMQVADPVGLWIGSVRLKYVRRLEHNETGDPIVPGCFPNNCGTVDAEQVFHPDPDDAPELTFPLILHVGVPAPPAPNQPPPPGHEVKLLRQVAVMWRNDRTVADVLIKGHYVLLTREGLAPGPDGLIERLDLRGGTLKEGRRFSLLKTAPTFHKDSTLHKDSLTGAPSSFPGSSSGVDENGVVQYIWTTEISIPAMDPLNPYIHRYHPDHGHPLVIRNTGGVPAKAGLDVTRTVTMTFKDMDPLAGTPDVNGKARDPRPEYGTSLIGGTYREIIAELTYDPVVVQGSFELVKAVPGIDKLNDGEPP